MSTPYEKERDARVARNKEKLHELGVKSAAARLAPPPVVTFRRQKQPGERKRAAAEEVVCTPVRTSRRVRARTHPTPGSPESGDGAEDGAPLPEPTAEVDELRALLTCEEYLERKGLPQGPLMTGRFGGWVKESVRVQLGMAASAEEAWESNGGGSFERRCPKGESAKEFARSMMLKNPNAFFYRHNTPGEETWAGDWSQAEVDLFVATAVEHGCGNKWGLFASYIPHRVGYQCSAFYRTYIVPRGLLRDHNFRLTSRGEAVWVAGGGRRGRGGGEED